MQNQNLTRLSFAGLFAALTAIFIYLIHIPYGQTGYIHLGDAVIFLCAVLLPEPYAAAAAAVGGGLADLISGFPIYILPTVLIKVCMALLLSSKTPKLLCKRNVIGVLLAAALNLLLYAVTEFVLGVTAYGMPAAGALATAVSTLLQNGIQGAANVVVFLPLAAASDRFHIKSKFHL